MRVLHFSDIHLGVPLGEVPWGDWPGKRLIGAAHLLMGRRRTFSRVKQKMVELDRFRVENAVDLILCTGDFTALGTDPELADARLAVHPLMAAPLGFIAIPGNHDVYMPDGVRDRRFERHFGDTLASDLADYKVDAHWPVIRLIGENAAVVAVNSARPNPNPWKASGRIPVSQLDALARALDDPRLRDRFVFVLTHYAPRLKDGSPDRYTHGLRNADEFLAVCRGIRRGAILFGHVHECYSVRLPDNPAPLFCAGSATQDFVEGFWCFDVNGTRAAARRGRWDGAHYALDEHDVYRWPDPGA
ncbi:MAG: metallophosphoesterase [Bryobacteraceae bacterium]|nr:metallophosphoesterase [Bryobacteraceae bacterium]